MRRLLRRLTCLAVLGGLGTLAFLFVQRRRATERAAEPVWPPLTPVDTSRPFVQVPADPPPPARWVPNVDGACPDGYPVKANDSSRIFHVPGGRFYDRTVPERWYATADDAVADGYRPAKA